MYIYTYTTRHMFLCMQIVRTHECSRVYIYIYIDIYIYICIYIYNCILVCFMKRILRGDTDKAFMHEVLYRLAHELQPRRVLRNEQSGVKPLVKDLSWGPYFQFGACSICLCSLFRRLQGQRLGLGCHENHIGSRHGDWGKYCEHGRQRRQWGAASK